MISRALAGLLVAGTLTLGVMGMAGTANAFSFGFPWFPWSPPKAAPVSAPELDPAIIGGGLALMLGTVLAVSERRRGKK